MATKAISQRKAIQNLFERRYKKELKLDADKKIQLKKKLVKQLLTDFTRISKTKKKTKKQLLNEKNIKVVTAKRKLRDIQLELSKEAKLKPEKNILSSRIHLNKVHIKDKIEYDRVQKDFLLAKPKLINETLLVAENFIQYIKDTFQQSIESFLKQKATFKAGHRRFISLGYHFYFKKGKQITIQTGYRKRQLLRPDNFYTVMKYQLSETLERFNKYFERKGSSLLYFEGLTLEVSFLK